MPMTNENRSYSYTEQTLITILRGRNWKSDGAEVHCTNPLLTEAAGEAVKLLNSQGVPSARLDSPAEGADGGRKSVIRADEQQLRGFLKRHDIIPEIKSVFTPSDINYLRQSSQDAEWERKFGRELDARFEQSRVAR